jgi:hypothetical protein
MEVRLPLVFPATPGELPAGCWAVTVEGTVVATAAVMVVATVAMAVGTEAMVVVMAVTDLPSRAADVEALRL